MKGKRFIVIMAIFLMLCSIQAISAVDDTNVTQNDALIVDDIQLSNVVEDTVITQDDSNITENAAEISDVSDTSSGISIGSSNVASAKNILGISNEDTLGITPGTFIYGVDYDSNRADDDIIPLERFFKAVYWGIRDYMQNNPSATREWNVFLNNKTFTGGYGDQGVSSIQTGYLSASGQRVNYLTFNGMNNNPNVALTIHLYGGRTIGDGLTSTLDLSGYGASYALIDFSTKDSSIEGINFKNFNVNDHPNTVDSNTETPFIKLGDYSNVGDNPEALIRNCTFENIVLNPHQPLMKLVK